MTKEQIVDALRGCSEYVSCEYCPCDPFCGGLMCMQEQAADLIESLSAQLEQVTRERDAAADGLRGKCAYCKNNNTGKCEKCTYYDYSLGEDLWELKGGQKDDR